MQCWIDPLKNCPIDVAFGPWFPEKKASISFAYVSCCCGSGANIGAAELKIQGKFLAWQKWSSRSRQLLKMCGKVRMNRARLINQTSGMGSGMMVGGIVVHGMAGNLGGTTAGMTGMADLGPGMGGKIGIAMDTEIPGRAFRSKLPLRQVQQEPQEQHPGAAEKRAPPDGAEVLCKTHGENGGPLLRVLFGEPH